MEDVADIVVEALEVFINHILFVRDIYPAQIFKTRRIYNTPVSVSIYPPLNTYLYEILKTSRELIRTNELQCAEMLVYKDEHKKYERYIFKVAVGEIVKNEDEFSLELEENFRSSLSTLSERLKGLKKLPSDAKFKVLLHSTHTAFIKLTHNRHYQNFPWLRANYKPLLHAREISLLPLTQISCIELDICAEIF